MDDNDLLKQLEETPITKLSVCGIKVRRKLANAGFGFLPELAVLTDDEAEKGEGLLPQEFIRLREKPLSRGERVSKKINYLFGPMLIY